MNLLKDERGGVGILFAGIVLLWFLYLLLGYGLYVSQAVSARAKLLETTLVTAKAGAAEVVVEQQSGKAALDRKLVKETAQEVFDANSPDKSLVKEWRLVDVRVATDTVEVVSHAEFTLRTPLGPKDQAVNVVCRAKARGFRE